MISVMQVTVDLDISESFYHYLQGFTQVAATCRDSVKFLLIPVILEYLQIPVAMFYCTVFINKSA